MIKKIVYVNETFYRKNRDLGIEYMEKQGYEVELWSLLKIKYPNILETPSDNTGKKVIYLKNHIEIISRIRKENLRHTMFFFTTTTHRGGIEDFIRIMICLFGGKYSNFIYEILPVGEINIKTRKSVWDVVKKNMERYKLNFYQLIIEKWCLPTYCFVPTKGSTARLLKPYEQSRRVIVHNKDFDEYIMKKNDRKYMERYIVYIDEDLINAEDFRKSNAEKIYPDSKLFYKNINRLFEQLEKYYNCKVVIAAHPKSEYRGNEYGNREIIYYKTNELVRDAFLVLAHASCANNFVILYRKNYIFLVDKYIKKHFVWNYLFVPQIKELHACTYDFGKGGEPWNYVNYPNKNYDKYYKKYINETENESKLFYQIVDEKIKEL